ncbi:hypothetical protein [Myroides sp.]|uniref:hypothetical protein n=1 Tax=Myroides sp. TaxID=1874736 RepID=UPI003F31E12E
MDDAIVYRHKDYRFIFIHNLGRTEDRTLMEVFQMNTDGTVKIPPVGNKGEGTIFMANMLTNIIKELINE